MRGQWPSPKTLRDCAGQVILFLLLSGFLASFALFIGEPAPGRDNQSNAEVAAFAAALLAGGVAASAWAVVTYRQNRKRPSR